MAGVYKTRQDIADAFNIGTVQTVDYWIKTGEWSKERQLTAGHARHGTGSGRYVSDAHREIEQMKNQHYKMWTAILSQLASHIKRAQKTGVTMNLKDINDFARALSSIQTGRRLVVDANLGQTDTEDRALKIEYQSLKDKIKSLKGEAIDVDYDKCVKGGTDEICGDAANEEDLNEDLNEDDLEDDLNEEE